MNVDPPPRKERRVERERIAKLVEKRRDVMRSLA